MILIMMTIDELKKELDALNAVESDLLNRVKVNDDIFEETMCPSSIANFLNCNSSKNCLKVFCAVALKN